MLQQFILKRRDKKLQNAHAYVISIYFFQNIYDNRI